MNGYKNIVKNKDTRLKILKMLSFVPDRVMIPIQYKIKTGNHLNLQYPQRYTEKLQWYKLYYHDRQMTQCSDTFFVRDYMLARGLSNYS